jgi:uncharacterized membrane protein YdjX (TVP38/TMEM64 family)
MGSPLPSHWSPSVPPGFCSRCEWLETCERWIAGLGIWGVALFALVYFLATVSLAPEWPLTIAAGLLYGVWGVAITVVTATIAASVAFLIARYLARAKIH